MSATASPRPAAPPPSRRGGAGRETAIFSLAILAIAIHVIDDNYVSPQPGTSAGDHLVSGLVPLALLALAAWAYPRLRAGARGALALFLGPLGIAAGIEGAYYTQHVGASGDDFTGLLAIPAGVALIALGAVTLWRSRRTDDGRAWRYARRALIGVAAFLAASLVVLPIGLAYVTTHVGRAVVPADRLGVAHEDVSFTTEDGLRLEGWYVPSRNGAAVIAFPGRKGTQNQARMLARHGFGVLLFDRRGEGESEGEPNSWGWGGDRDVKAAVAWLSRRQDVDPRRIGGIGLSVGGEMLLDAAADTPRLGAVVSEGAGARSVAEDLDHDVGALDQALGGAMSAVRTASVAMFSNQRPPTHLKKLVPRISPRPLLLIAAPHSPNGEDLNRLYYHVAGRPKELWEIPESKHVGGLESRPREYERRVVAFFDRALAP